jgi:hypothetical protein
MSRDLTRLAVVAGIALSTIAPRMVEGAPPCRPQAGPAEHAAGVDADRSALRLQGSHAAVRLEACQSTIAAVLSALSDYGISYRSSITLNEARNGTYAGSPGQVIARVLDGYSYVMKHDGSHIDIIIYGKRGESAVAAPIAAQVSQNSERLPRQVSRNR